MLGNDWPLNLLDSGTNEDVEANQQTVAAVMYAPFVVCLIPHREVVRSYCLREISSSLQEIGIGEQEYDVRFCT